MSVAVSTLKNGLRVVSDTLPNVETVTVGTWVDVGSRFESAAENGLSHMLEHMAFKGTEKRSAYDIRRANTPHITRGSLKKTWNLVLMFLVIFYKIPLLSKMS